MRIASPVPDNALPASCSTFVDILRWRAQHQPDRLAYLFLSNGEQEEARITYAQLDEQARSIAARLQQYVLQGERTLLLYPPGLAYIAAFMGCLYAGVIAVPAYPPSSQRSLGRIQTIAADADSQLVLTIEPTVARVKRWSEDMPDMKDMHWIATDEAPQNQDAQWQPCSLTPETLTFLQYTSGSTGTPKGVMVSHGNLMHNSALMCERWGHSSESVNISWLPIFHDMGLIAGVLQPLYGGFPAVLMAPAAFIQRPLRWLRAISTYRGTTSWAPNFAYELCTRKIMPEEQEHLDLSSWRVAGNGAEPVRAETIEQFSRRFAISGFRREAFTPGYGLAEGTLMVSSSALDARPTILHLDKDALEQHRVVVCAQQSERTQPFVGCGAVGADQRAVIVHPETKLPCASDEVGEIWISGPSVAQGYWRRSQETAQVFAASLAETGEGPFLRTGDLGFISHGEIFITGRLKDCIIIRGRNHYPQDIELTAERSHVSLRPGCGAAFTIEVGHEERLVLVHELARNYQEPAQICMALRRDIAQLHELQVYAIVLICYGSIYKTSSGKIQRRACREAFLRGNLDVIAQDILEEETVLPDKQDDERISWTMIASLPGEEQHRLLQTYVQEQLGHLLHLHNRHIALDEPISAYGLDSLKVAEFQMSIENDLRVFLPFTDLLSDLTVSDLATNLLTQLRQTQSGVQHPPVKRADHALSAYPLSSAQEQLWFLYQLDPQTAIYNVPIALRIQGHLDIKAFERSIDEIVRRHEVVHAAFQVSGEQLVQRIRPDVSVQLTLVDVRSLSGESKRRVEVQRHVQQEEQRPFDLSQDVLLLVTLLLLAPGESALLITMHHIICNGRSIGLFMQELEQLYDAFHREEPSPLPSLPVCYTDYVLWQQALVRSEAMTGSLAYWKRLLDHMAVLDFPTDRTRPGVQSYRGATQRFSLPPALKQQYQELCNREGATLFMAFLAAFQILLMRYSGQEDIALGTVVANRPRPELMNLLGFFVNTIVIRSEIAGKNNYRQILQTIRKVCLDAYDHQDVPFAKLAEELRPARNLSYNPLFQVLFSWQPDVLEDLHMPGLVLTPYEVKGTTSKFDLSIEMAEGKDSLTATVV